MSDLIQMNLVLNQQAAAKQQSFESIGSNGGQGQSLPLITVILPMFKDSKAGFDGMFSANGYLSGTTGFLGPEKSWDRFIKGGYVQGSSASSGTSTGASAGTGGGDSDSGNYYQNMVASSRSNSNESGASLG
jgi:hypothetical protein